MAGAAGFLGIHSESALAEPPPETVKLRLVESPIICTAPQYVAQDLLQGEGFTDVRYITSPHGWNEPLATGEADLSLMFGPPQIVKIDAGAPIVVLAGSHVGCVELVGGSKVRTTRDLKGKTIVRPRAGACGPRHHGPASRSAARVCPPENVCAEHSNTRSRARSETFAIAIAVTAGAPAGRLFPPTQEFTDRSGA